MENFEKRMGVFPALLDPAKEAVKKMLREGTSAQPIEGKDGFFVAPKGTVDAAQIFFTFDFEGAQFVIFENAP